LIVGLGGDFFHHTRTQLRRGAAIDLLHGGVETPHGAETRRDRDLRHGQRRFIDELLGEVQTAGLRDGARARAQMAQKQPAQMTRAESKVRRKRLDAAFLEAAFVDESQCPRHRVLRTGPGGCSGRTLRPAAQARPEAGLGRCRGGREVAHVFLLRGARAADGAAIDARREHGDVELAVEARVACQPRARAELQIERHGSILWAPSPFRQPEIARPETSNAGARPALDFSRDFLIATVHWRSTCTRRLWDIWAPSRCVRSRQRR
jgi:hypothetical protein